MTQTFIFVTKQLVEVKAKDREQAIKVLRAYPPMREYNGGLGFSIRTRREIEIHDAKNQDETAD